jgi:hypothetical protein
MPPFDNVVQVFPTDGVAFSYDLNTGAWSIRRGFHNGAWTAWAPQAYTKWGSTHLIGLTDGTIAELSMDAHDDNGETLRCVARSGFFDHGTLEHKHGHYTVVARRGEAESAESAISFKWRDGLGSFTKPIFLALGTEGDDLPEMHIKPAGPPYGQRELELSWSAADAVAVTKVLESFTPMET